MGDRLIFLNIFRIEKLRYFCRSFFFINIIELKSYLQSGDIMFDSKQSQSYPCSGL